jgi:hypothetical protein
VGRFTLRRPWALDLRSLALLRIGLAAMVLLDLAIRATDFREFYWDSGLLPRDEFLRLPAHSTYYCVHLWMGGPGLALIWLVHAAAATALLLGYRTRWAAALTWYLTASLQLRNPFLLDGGDDELRLMLFWLPFLPCAARCSLDAGLRSTVERSPAASVATFGYLTQIVCLYLFAGIFKTDPVWTTTGQALYYLLSIDVFSSRFAHVLLGYPELLKSLSFASLGFERLGPLLLVCPVLITACRSIFLLGLVALHLGIALCMHLGIFPAIAIVSAFGLIPGAFWDRQRALPEIQLSWLPSPSNGGPIRHPAVSFGLGVVCVTVVAWNVLSLHAAPKNFPEPVYTIGFLTREYQRWDLYAPRPMLDDGWFVLDGATRDGQEIDLMRDGQPVDWNKPELVSAQFKNQRYRRWFQNIRLEVNAPLQVPYVRHRLEQWNQGHPDRLIVSLKLVYMLEMTPPPGEPAKIEPQTVAAYRL